MPIKLKCNETEYHIETILWDRDSYFIDFNGYWSRLIGLVAQKVAEHTTNNWNKFNTVRTEVIKVIGIDLKTDISNPSSPINILPINTFPALLVTGLRNSLTDKKTEELNFLIQDLISRALIESQVYIKDSLILKNIDIIKNLNNQVKQILITNDSNENNDIFLKELKLDNFFYQIYTQTNKEHIDDIFKHNCVFITNNSYLHTSYEKRGIKKVLLLYDLNNLTYSNTAENQLIKINIDGASRGNPGLASIGIVFYKDKEIIKEASEFIGTHTNNYAEYTALIRALEICLTNGYHNIEVNSDSELIVNQINKKYKVKDSDIKDLFDKAYSLIDKLLSFKIIHVPREENLKADKLANIALKEPHLKFRG